MSKQFKNRSLVAAAQKLLARLGVRFAAARVLAIAGASVCLAAPMAAHAGPLSVGAAKVDITPSPLPDNFRGVLDPIYARAIVVESDGTRAAMITIDAGGVSTDIWKEVS